MTENEILFSLFFEYQSGNNMQCSIQHTAFRSLEPFLDTIKASTVNSYYLQYSIVIKRSITMSYTHTQTLCMLRLLISYTIFTLYFNKLLTFILSCVVNAALYYFDSNTNSQKTHFRSAPHLFHQMEPFTLRVQLQVLLFGDIFDARSLLYLNRINDFQPHRYPLVRALVRQKVQCTRIQCTCTNEENNK